MPFNSTRFGEFADKTPASVMGPSSAGSGNYNPVTSPANSGGGSMGSGVVPDDNGSGNSVFNYSGPTSQGGGSGLGAGSEYSQTSGKFMDFGENQQWADMAYKGQGQTLGGYGDWGGNPKGTGEGDMPQTQPVHSGGEYGVNGQGAAGLSSTGTGGTASGWAYDDGGVVPEDNAATVDPMTVIQKALTAGRQSMGLPAQFYGGGEAEQSFADGGEVEGGVIPDDQGEGGQGMPDPRKTLQYLTGAGAVSPDIANAMEMQADPDGAMDASERKVKAIASAGNPQQQFGLMQHYRSRYNMHSAYAKAALTGGKGRGPDLGQAAMAATQAFENVPTGASVRFAPTRGGIAVMARPHGKQQTMQDGGEVEEDKWAGLPESSNIEDRRGESYGVTSKDQGASPEGVGTAQLERYSQSKSSTQDDEGVIRKKKTQSFDDGGEVEEEGVLPADDTAAEAAPAEQPQEAPPEQPTVLTPQQFKSLLDAGYDKPVESGWQKFLQSALAAVTPAPAAAAEAQPRQGVNVLDQLRQGNFSAAGKGVVSNAKDMLGISPDTDAALETEAAPATPTPQPRPAGAPQAAPEAPTATGPGAQTVMPKTNALDTRQKPQAQAAAPQAPTKTADEQFEERVTDQAQRLYPWASMGNQRSNYIRQMLEKHHEQQGRMDIEHAKGKGELEKMKELGRNSRYAAGLEVKRDATSANIAQKDRATQANFVRSESNSLRLAHPSITPQEIIEHLQKAYNIDPTLIQQTMQTPQGGARGGTQSGNPSGAQPMSGRPKGSNTEAATVGDVRPYTKNGVTKSYKFGTDGQWHRVD